MHSFAMSGAHQGVANGVGALPVLVDRKTIATSATTFNFTGVNFGTGHPRRALLIVFATKTSSGLNDVVLASSQVAGNPASSVCANGFELIGNGVLLSTNRFANLGTISLTFPKAQANGCTIEVYSIRNYNMGPSLSASTGTSSGVGGTNTLTAGAITVADMSLGVGAAVVNNTTQGFTWSGLDKISEATAGDGSFKLSFAARLLTPAGSKTFAVTIGTGSAKSMSAGSVNR